MYTQPIDENNYTEINIKILYTFQWLKSVPVILKIYLLLVTTYTLNKKLMTLKHSFLTNSRFIFSQMFKKKTR